MAELDAAHWDKNYRRVHGHEYRQRMTKKEWQSLLLERRDHVNYKGNLVPLKAVYIGAGVYEVFKDIPDNGDD